MQKLLPPQLAALSILVMLGLSYVAPIATTFGNPILASILIVVGIALLLAGSAKFSSEKTNIKTFNAPNKLVTTGLFRYSRNPMYLGFTLLLTGVATAFATISAFLVALAFFIIANLWYIPFEERKMEEVFGQDYLTYKARVRRWL